MEMPLLSDKLFVYPTTQLCGRERVPTSKPHMQRAILLSLLTAGTSTVANPSWSTETKRLLKAAMAFGMRATQPTPTRLTLTGTGEALSAPQTLLDAGGSAFMFRSLAALSAVASGTTIIQGNHSMRSRPVVPFLSFLPDLGATVEDISDARHLRVRVRGASSFGGTTAVDTTRSSQFLTALLLVSPRAESGVTIHTPGPRLCEGYVRLTLAMMADRGLCVAQEANRFEVPYGSYAPYENTVPTDLTALSYLVGAVGTVLDAQITVEDYRPSGMAAEVDFLEAIGRLGVSAAYDAAAHSLTLSKTAPAQGAIEIDARNMPTAVPALAAMAPYVEGTVKIVNAAHINHHKCPRLTVMIDQLRRLGCGVDPILDKSGTLHGLKTTGRQHPAGNVRLCSHGDHRIFAALLIASLGAQRPTFLDGALTIDDGFPDFLDAIGRLGVKWQEGLSESPADLAA